MFSKEEAALVRKEFWLSFAKSFPKKWLLYNTKIKGFAFKFHADRNAALVLLDIEPKSDAKRTLLYEQLQALQPILTENYLPEIVFSENYRVASGKEVSRIYTALPSPFNIYNKNTWPKAFEFFNEKMSLFERFFFEYEGFIKEADL